MKHFGEDPRDTLTLGWGTDLTPRRIPLGLKSKIGTITDLKRGEKLDPLSYPPRRSRPVEHQGDPRERSPAFISMGGGMAQERCIPIPWQTKIIPEAVGTWWKDVSIAMVVQWTGNRPMVACTQYSGDDLDTKAIHPSQGKMKKMQRTGIRPMVVGTQYADFIPRAKTNFYLK